MLQTLEGASSAQADTVTPLWAKRTNRIFQPPQPHISTHATQTTGPLSMHLYRKQNLNSSALLGQLQPNLQISTSLHRLHTISNRSHVTPIKHSTAGHLQPQRTLLPTLANAMSPTDSDDSMSTSGSTISSQIADIPPSSLTSGHQYRHTFLSEQHTSTMLDSELFNLRSLSGSVEHSSSSSMPKHAEEGQKFLGWQQPEIHQFNISQPLPMLRSSTSLNTGDLPKSITFEAMKRDYPEPESSSSQ